VTRKTRRASDWIFSARRHSTVVSPDRQTVYSFDLEGRPLVWFERGRTYKRSLASEVYGRQRVGGRKRYWTATPDEAAEHFERMLRAVSRAPAAGLDRTIVGRLNEILDWPPDRLLAERRRFDAAYREIGILPPDQYLAVVLQATFGCTWNRCSFCSFYQDQPFRVRTRREFAAHAREVRSLLGRGERLRRRIFLASGNALTLANHRLLPLVRSARTAFPGRPWSGFVDVFTGERKALQDWTELREAGLERVHVGLETGDDRLLGWLNKPGSQAASLDLVATLERAGLRLSLILMVGVGGGRFAADHVRNTLSLVDRLPLGRGDSVYLSPFVDLPDSEYARRAADDGVRPLDRRQSESQYHELRDGIRLSHPSVKVARYDLREFLY
jgi:radical SAM superfamily enzyme YgiQ (UPF0313 family)